MGDYTQVPTPPADSVATPSVQPDVSILDPNRPVSTIPADSPEATSSAQPNPADSTTQPVPEPELQPDQVLEGSASADVIPPADPNPIATDSADLQPIIPISPQPPESPQVSDAPAPPVSPIPEPQVSPPPTPPEAQKESSIQDTSQPNQPAQVHPDVQVSAPSTPTPPIDQSLKESAEIKLEPLEGTQNTIPADSKIQEPSKPSSFGDLMGNPSDLSEEPTIHIDPIEAPTMPPVTQESPPVVPPPEQTLTQGRQRSVEARKQNREENLNKILELVQKNRTINNLDVRDYLHISQTTATDYLHTLVNSGKLKKEGKAKATKYFL